MIVREVLSDVDNRLSSKRIIVFIAFFLIGIAFIADLFFSYEVSENVYNGMMWIVISGLGIVGSEKFIKGVDSPFGSQIGMQSVEEERAYGERLNHEQP